MKELLARLGDPHLQMPVVHVAGTKGKGSTAAMIGSVLSAAGYRTGLFTSPHIERLEERIAIDGCPCSPDELVELSDETERVKTALEMLTPREREVLLLWDAGHSYGEIAQHTGLAPGAIGTTLARARRRLAEAYEELGERRAAR